MPCCIFNDLIKKGIISNLSASFTRGGNNKHRTACGDGSEMQMSYVLFGINYADGCGGKEIQQNLGAKKTQQKNTDLEIIHSCFHSLAMLKQANPCESRAAAEATAAGAAAAESNWERERMRNWLLAPNGH